MKKRSILLFISLMFLALNACGTTDTASSDFKVDFEHMIDPGNPLQVTYFTAMPSREEYGDIAVEWDLGDGTISTEDRVTHIYKEPGDYKVKLSVSSLSDKSQIVSETVKDISVQITVKNLDFNFNHSSDTPLVVTFTALGTIENGELEYKWDFGNNVIKTGLQVTHSFPNTSVHKVMLTVNVKGTNYNTSVEKDIDLSRYITDVRIDYGPFPSAPLSINFQAMPTPYIKDMIYSWDFGDGKTDESDIASNGKARRHYENAGLYTVKVTAKIHESDLGKTFQKVIQVGEVITDFDFTYTVSPDNPLQYFVEATSDSKFGETTYEWQYGFGKITTGKRTQITFDKYGTHDVILRVYVNGVEVDKTITKTITTAPAPTITGVGFTYALRPDNNIYVNFIASATASNGAEINYKWDFRFGDKGEGKEVSHRFEYYSTYRVTLTATIEGAEPVVYSKDVVVMPDQLVDFDCVDIAGNNIDNLMYRCTANVNANAGLVNPTFEWEITDSSQGFYHSSTAKTFTTKFPLLSVYKIKLKVKEQLIVKDFEKDLAVLTTPIHRFQSVLDKKNLNGLWWIHKVSAYLHKTWYKVNPAKVDVTVDIRSSQVGSGSFLNNPANRYTLQNGRWCTDGNATVRIRYSIKGTNIYKELSKYWGWDGGPKRCY